MAGIGDVAGLVIASGEGRLAATPRVANDSLAEQLTLEALATSAIAPCQESRHDVFGSASRIQWYDLMMGDKLSGLMGNT
jgi:hypothetical protein